MINSKLCGWSGCERKGLWLPLSDFGVNRATLSGLNGYCRKCLAEKAAAARAGKVIRVAKKYSGVFEVQGVLPFALVMEAIKHGAHSRIEIKKATRLGWDTLGESLAVLRFDKNILITRVVKDERCFYLAA